MMTTLMFWISVVAAVPMLLAFLQAMVRGLRASRSTLSADSEKLWESLASFCPNCWCNAPVAAGRCPWCGYGTSDFNALPLDAKLIVTLKHPDREIRIKAIRQLGEMKRLAAIPSFQSIAHEERDPIVLAEVARALSRIGGAAAKTTLAELQSHDSPDVRRVVGKALKVASGRARSDRLAT